MRRRYILWIVLAAVALIGSVVIQSIWIAKGYQQARSHLQDQLESALAQTIDDLTLAEEIAFISEVEEEFGEVQEVMEYRYVHDSSIVWEEETHRQGEVDSALASELKGLEVKIRGEEPTAEGSMRIEVISSISGNEVDTIIHTEEAALEEVLQMERSGRLNAVMRRIKVENIRRKGDWKDRIDSTKIHEALGENLEEQSLKIPYAFSVTDKEGASFTNLSMKAYSDDFEVDATAPLFPADLRSKDIYLNVQLQAGFADVFREVGLMAGFSGLFTLIMLLLFVLLWRKLLGQEKLSEMKSNFIGNMSHELRTPLATISLAADSIVHPKTASDPQATAELVHTIKREHDRILRHVDRVLQMAHSDQGDFPLERSDIQLPHWLQMIVDQYQSRALKEEKKIELIYDGEDQVVHWDDLHMRSALENLIDNAFNYNPPGTVLRVVLKLQNGRVKIQVIDNGVGISDEDRASVFERFYRGQGGNLHEVKGFGLGLNYVQVVVNAHGGSLTLKSKRGEGSTFTIELPLHG